MPNSINHCPICRNLITYYGQANYYDRSSRYLTPIYHCKSCDIFYRDVPNANLTDHYYAASYVQKENEASLFLARIHFFKYIISIVKKHARVQSNGEDNRITLVDFGSSYGHLLQLAHDEGIRALGVELNKDMIEFCRKKELVVYEEIGQINQKVDAITSIDSLYCVPNCRELLEEMKKILKPQGILVVRLTNRNFYAKVYSCFWRRGDLSAIGDAVISYSLKGMKKLLALTGFSIIKIIPDYGRGKKLSIGKKLQYLFTYILTLFTRNKRIMTPGFIVIAKVHRNQQA